MPSSFVSLKTFIQEFRSTIIENGLDDIINNSLTELKADLKLLIDKEIRNVSETPEEATKQELINLPKSDEAVIEHLTGIDIKKINLKKDYKSAVDTKVCPITRDKKGDPLVRAKIKVGPGDTLEQLFSQARKFFNESIFIIPNRDGSTTLKINGGFNLDKWVKIVCSTEKGLTDLSEARYAKTWQPKGEVEFTLKQEAIKQYIEANNNNFVNITEVVTKIKENDIPAAKQVLQNIKNTNKLPNSSSIDTLVAQTEKLETKTGLSKDMLDYYSLTELIDNIHIEKTVRSTTVLYKLMTTSSADKNKSTEFFMNLTSKINIWFINNEASWKSQFKTKLRELLTDYAVI